jgi:dihydrofolate reductase
LYCAVTGTNQVKNEIFFWEVRPLGKIGVFDFVSMDGFFAGPKGEIDWFKLTEKDEKFDRYTGGRASGKSTLVFGHTTYTMMSSFWPTPEAMKTDSKMANVMINSPKIVFSKKFKSVKEGPNWKNVTLFHEIKKDEILKLKGKTDMTILGSGNIVQQFAKLGLIDEYMLVIVPVILGAGKYIFNGVKKTELELLESRSFKNGAVVNRYRVK